MSNTWGGPPGGYPPPGYPPPGVGPTQPGAPYFAPPPPGYPPGYTPMPSGGAVAWEDRSQSIFSRWWGTFKDASFNWKPFYSAAAQNEDPWPAVTFSTVTMGLTGLIGGIFFGLFYAAIGGIGALAAASSKGGGMGPAILGGFAGMMAAVGVGIAVVFPILYTMVGFITPWISGGIHHLGLLMVGGATKPYASTVRVVGYATATHVFSFLPGVGGLMAIGLNIMSVVMGLDETHKCGTGKAVFATLFPWLFFCLCYCGCNIALSALGAAR